jgi:hypothetical protein
MQHHEADGHRNNQQIKLADQLEGFRFVAPFGDVTWLIAKRLPAPSWHFPQVSGKFLALTMLFESLERRMLWTL